MTIDPPGARTVAAGEAIPPVTIELTLQRLVMVAAANRDFAPIHHDRDVARSIGAGEPFVNMMFIMALYERTALSWGGPGSRVLAMRSLRMSAFNRAGDSVACDGEVVSADGNIAVLAMRLWTAADRETSSATVVVDYRANSP